MRSHWARSVLEGADGGGDVPIEPLDLHATRPAAADAGPTEPLVPLRAARREATQAFERAYLANVLKRTRGNVTRAAALAEVSRQMMQKLMRKHGTE